MAESDWLIAGVIIGALIGIPLGWILAQALSRPAAQPSSVVFDRDQEGRISGIHYVPAGGKG
jgi:ABC-type antimicrobial peptide transport system permease subunit